MELSDDKIMVFLKPQSSLRNGSSAAAEGQFNTAVNASGGIRICERLDGVGDNVMGEWTPMGVIGFRYSTFALASSTILSVSQHSIHTSQWSLRNSNDDNCFRASLRRSWKDGRNIEHYEEGK
jgi:hypothetical protein